MSAEISSIKSSDSFSKFGKLSIFSILITTLHFFIAYLLLNKDYSGFSSFSIPACFISLAVNFIFMRFAKFKENYGLVLKSISMSIWLLFWQYISIISTYVLYIILMDAPEQIGSVGMVIPLAMAGIVLYFHVLISFLAVNFLFLLGLYSQEDISIPNSHL